MEISEKDIEYLSYMERTDLFYRAMPKDITDETTLIYGQLVQFGKKLYIVNYENWKSGERYPSAVRPGQWVYTSASTPLK